MSRAIEMYEQLARDGSREDVEGLRAEVQAHLQTLGVAQRKSELVPLDLAEVLAARLEGLLAGAMALPAEHRAAVLGAARYFISAEDAVPDTRSCTGLDDDVAVFNHVVGLIGRADLRIED